MVNLNRLKTWTQGTNMEKNGMLTEESASDFDNTKKAEYYDEAGPMVADKANIHKLTKPRPICESCKN